jgi:hypothetical protein
METGPARALAERLHEDDRDADGASVLAHIARVARETPTEARALAWLHEALGRGAATEQELLAIGVSIDELRALRLLTWPSWTRSVDVHLAHARLIAHAAGWSGAAARLVTMADLRDRTRYPPVAPGAWSPPYRASLRLLLDSGAGGVGAITRRTTAQRPPQTPAPSPAR